MREITTTIQTEDPEVTLRLDQPADPERPRQTYDTKMVLTIEEAEALYVRLGAEVIRAKAVAAAFRVGKP